MPTIFEPPKNSTEFQSLAQLALGQDQVDPEWKKDEEWFEYLESLRPVVEKPKQVRRPILVLS